MSETGLPIRKLPPLVVNQIAAGEVIERPASVVKELVENALDAGATRVLVEIEQGGVELVRVTDDGAGIAAEELPLALAPHATSKIGDVSDLDRVATMGFRGEALASITSVARVRIRSRKRGQGEAAQVEAEGDAVGPVQPAAGPTGTSVTVRNLFFNTPARRKFLRSLATEQGHCLDWLRDLALAWPAVGFRVTADGREVLDVPPGQGPRERALGVLGPELAPQLLEVHLDGFDDARGLALWGLAGRPEIARGSNKHQHVFVNGRTVRDRTIQHALKEAYRGLIEPGRHPTAVLMLSMGPEGVDVNVHPAKLEVRFRDQSMVHSGVLRAVREALRSADLTPEIATARGRVAEFGAGESLLPRGPEAPPERRFADYFTRPPAPAPGRLSFSTLRETLDAGSAMGDERGDARAEDTPARGAAAVGSPGFAPGADSFIVPTARSLQVHNAYVVTQDEQGIVIVDQHALHERAMFEFLLARVTGAPLERQHLLAPAIIDVEPGQGALLDALRPLLGRIGVEAEMLGPRSIGVRSFPSFLFERNVDPVEFMSDLFDKAASDRFAPDSEEALRDVLDMMACKAAVRAGDRLKGAELEALLELREDVERSSNCPHGRPTSIRLSLKELERRFGRA
ncbi:MAG: DNA mismatch repair endonuclease MutL [Phycisphaerales bacterium]|nr:DNA mismatch repair endonuclease MutL [Phycisphaerales bacterium]